MPQSKQNRSDLSIKNRSLLLRKERETPPTISQGLQSVSRLIQLKNKICKNRKDQRKMVFASGKLSSHKSREHTQKSLVRC